jgi:hypothetical protein
LATKKQALYERVGSLSHLHGDGHGRAYLLKQREIIPLDEIPKPGHGGMDAEFADGVGPLDVLIRLLDVRLRHRFCPEANHQGEVANVVDEEECALIPLNFAIRLGIWVYGRLLEESYCKQHVEIFTRDG